MVKKYKIVNDQDGNVEIDLGWAKDEQSALYAALGELGWTLCVSEVDDRMRKVYVELKVKLVITVDKGVDVDKVINELDYDFSDTTTQATVEDTVITDYEIVDSK